MRRRVWTPAYGWAHGTPKLELRARLRRSWTPDNGAGLRTRAWSGHLRNFPPLVFVKEVRDLKAKLAEVALGKVSCSRAATAPRASRSTRPNYIRDYFQLFLQMALILTFAGDMSVVKVGRVAGQFAKPRSSPIEKRDGQELPSYHGDIINGPDFTPEAAPARPAPPARGLPPVGRNAQFPARLARRRLCSARQRARWSLKFMGGTPVETHYEELADEIKRTRRVQRACSASRPRTALPSCAPPSFYTSHEALLLSYEQALTRRDESMARASTCDLRPHAVDRRPHAPARPRARRVLPRHRQPDRPQVRAVARRRRAAAPDRRPQSQERARPPHADLPLRRRQDRRAACRRWCAR